MASGNFQKYNSKNPVQRLLLNRFLKIAQDFAIQIPCSTYLDIGCAEGFFLQSVQLAKPDAVCMGIDIDTAALDRGKDMFPLLNLQKGNLHNVTYEPHSFDCVMCLEVLEHLENPLEGLKKLQNLTRKYLLLSVPHEPFFCLANFLRGKNIVRLGNDPDHRNHWNRKSFAHFLEKNDVTIIKHITSFPWQLVLAEIKH